MRFRLLTALVALGCAACSPGGDTIVGGNMTAQATMSWDDFVKNSIEQWFKLDPAFAVYQGRHDFDGKLPDWSEKGLDAKAAFLKETVRKARTFNNLNKQQQFERDYIIKVAEGQLFWLEDADLPHRNPSYYVGGGLDPNVYVARNYADPKVRMRAMIEFFNAVPQSAQQIRANLQMPLPETFIDYGVAAFNGFAEYYTGDARAAFADVKDDGLHQRFDESAMRAAKSLQGLAQWLDNNRGKATQHFQLGPERFARMLKTTEAVDIPLDQLEAIGRADLKRNQQALAAACAEYAAGKTIPECVGKMNADKPEGGPVAAARKQVEQLRAFVTSHDLVSIPGTEQARVEEAPPYNRQNLAYIDPPGPFEKGIPSIYYISPPNPEWSKEKQQAYIPGKDDLLFVTVHEVMPGHFVQFLHANRSDFLFGRLFVGYAFAEGWAHYAEEMMWDAGYGDGSPEVHIGQLSNALLRDCRFLSAIGLHARGMTVAQSREMFEQQCYIDPGNAEQQAARGTYDPAYLNYTLGKLMIRKLRDDWTASRGGRKAWKAFHDQFLSYGGPPIPLVRQQMMGEAKPRAVF
ncbi:DUF885 domain-containing protein [Stakelama pacifica]|uniref:Uncharacterized protein (DUF885 family) n=1 Tax=Stakelama pacifica TaxID=517720 RepID=A0A4R6FZE0_9SPHN|nr:DUF885 domain-containing protein [Stakelama pacifica]TDN86515.1 uncharacterized protein (DUF885 family) [Stakelama pacifica]GGO89873.1 hypothetical protein GCM10011329_00860 [Stakelama pacifica]